MQNNIMKKDLTAFTDFQKLDIRVGEVKECSPLEGAKKLLRLKVDLGVDYAEVQILSGLAEFYKPEDLLGKKFMFIANLEPRKMMGTDSQGMIMAADDGERPIIIPVDQNLQNGTIVR